MSKPENTLPALDLLERLQTVFPSFGNAELLVEVETEELGLHGVMHSFAEYFGSNCHTATKKQLTALARILDHAVTEGGKLENAVSTCFLEHVHQLRCKHLLTPFVSRTTKQRMRA